ncbi:hypothetical protein Z947_3402 [Sulfitobacter geojensis]|nr:hypothetical protein Z947_3402 [Sulfitobacter geojensis]
MTGCLPALLQGKNAVVARIDFFGEKSVRTTPRPPSRLFGG